MPRFPHHIRDGSARAGFGRPCSEDDAPHPRHHGRSRAHHAGFEGDYQGAVLQAPTITVLSCRLPDRQHFRVGCGIAICFTTIDARPDHLPLRVDDQRCNGHVFGRSCCSKFNGLLHPGFVLVHRRGLREADANDALVGIGTNDATVGDTTANVANANAADNAPTRTNAAIRITAHRSYSSSL